MVSLLVSHCGNSYMADQNLCKMRCWRRRLQQVCKMNKLKLTNNFWKAWHDEYLFCFKLTHVTKQQYLQWHMLHSYYLRAPWDLIPPYRWALHTLVMRDTACRMLVDMWLNVNTLMVHKMEKESWQWELSGVAQMGLCVKGVSQNLLVEKIILAQHEFSQI